ncbi:MAG: archease [Ignavibacteria bacterium]|nr:archease [Ignavibacteria bacterium]
MSYKFLDHTSDIGIEVKSSSIQEAFVESIYGLLEIIFGKSLIEFDSNSDYEVLEVSSIDRESLLVDTLNEILFLIDTKKIIPLKPEILEMSNNFLKLRYKPCQFDYQNFPIHLYVKAVTFHQLEIKEIENQTEIKFFVDI